MASGERLVGRRLASGKDATRVDQVVALRSEQDALPSDEFLAGSLTKDAGFQ